MVDDERLDLFLIAADTPGGVIERYTWLTGRPPPVPRWSLGAWLSRAYYKTPRVRGDRVAEVRERWAAHAT